MGSEHDERLKKEEGRYNTLLSLYEQLKSTYTGQVINSIYINKEFLACAVRSYFDDIYRFKEYSGSEYADNHKQAAYTIKWIARFRPIQIKEEVAMTTELLTINSVYALYAGFVFLDLNISNVISQHFFDHLIYTTQYRNLSGRQLATTLYVLECAVKQKNF
jgi:hypothetical protein